MDLSKIKPDFEKNNLLRQEEQPTMSDVVVSESVPVEPETPAMVAETINEEEQTSEELE